MREVLVRAAAALIIALAAANSAAAASTPAQLSVCLVLSPALAIDTRGAGIMLSELTAIWTPHGVAARWVGQSADGCDRLIAVKADHEARAEDLTRESALGWVPFVEGRARQLVFLRVERARTLVDALSPGSRPAGLTNLLHARLLGRSLAHELGHVLLNSGDHSSSGLMRAHYRAGDVLRFSAAAYTLNASERADLLTRGAAGSSIAAR